MSEKTTRDHIVEAADRLFYRHGFEHTSFSNIADAVRISRGNFYYHFKSKDEILDAVIRQRLAGTEAMLQLWDQTLWLSGRDVVRRDGEAFPSGAIRSQQAVYVVPRLAALAIRPAGP